jgi:ABC-2 type transport system ATP-binding protein
MRREVIVARPGRRRATRVVPVDALKGPPACVAGPVDATTIRAADTADRYPRSMIEVRGLVKRYRDARRNAVDGIDLAVEDGAFFALLGPNGAGKTTTISILTTTLAPTDGRATIDGFDVVGQANEVRRRVGIIFQKPSLDQNLTAEENIRFHAVLFGLYPYRPAYRLMPPAYRTQVAELAALLGLEREIFDPIRTYSGGMRRKLEIARSLIHRPRVLFLDEPTAGLDTPSRRTLWDHLRTVRAESGTTIVLTTHYLEEAEQADRICIIDGGRIVAEGTPAALKADLSRESLLIDAPDRDRLRAELARLHLRPLTDGPFTIALDGSGAHAILRAIETPLTVVRTLSPSLEDAYLEIVARAEGSTDA